jgi:hypothetical protein
LPDKQLLFSEVLYMFIVQNILQRSGHEVLRAWGGQKKTPKQLKSLHRGQERTSSPYIVGAARLARKKTAPLRPRSA